MKPASEKRTRAWAETRFSNFQLANSGYSINNTSGTVPQHRGQSPPAPFPLSPRLPAPFSCPFRSQGQKVPGRRGGARRSVPAADRTRGAATHSILSAGFSPTGPASPSVRPCGASLPLPCGSASLTPPSATAPSSRSSRGSRPSRLRASRGTAAAAAPPPPRRTPAGGRRAPPRRAARPPSRAAGA